MKRDARLIFCLPSQILEEIRKAATKRHLSMGTYVLQAVILRLKNEEGKDYFD